MYLRSLELTNYRNFRKAPLELRDGPTVVLGDNGQGKSNLLEAIEILATAKSARAGSDRELMHWAVLAGGPEMLAESFARVRATVEREGRQIRAEVLIRPQRAGLAAQGGAETLESPVGRPEQTATSTLGDADGLLSSLDLAESTPVSKTFRLNGIAKRALEFVGAINVVAFSPLDIALVAGPPAGRRRYLDVMIGQVNSRYLYALQRYQKVVLQRNHLLRQIKGRAANDSGLGVWTEQLRTEGAFLILERAGAVAELTDLADGWFRELGGGGARMAVVYRPALGPSAALVERLPRDGDDGLAIIERAFGEELARIRPRELIVGVSLAGPHRDDLRFFLDGVDLQVYGSRGQQRLAALALKLAEADLLERRTGSRPILLMDDVLSELDRRRQQAVLRFAAGSGQTLLTVTNLEVIGAGGLPGAEVLRVEAGTVNPRPTFPR